MTKIATLARIAALAVVSCVGLAATTPAFASPEDVALLESYIGNWKAQGAVTGPKGNTETVGCRLNLIDGNGDKVNFQGRCSYSGATVTMNGAMVYVEGADHYEAVMTTSVGFTGQAVGVRKDDGIYFELHDVGQDEEGNNMTVTSTFTLTGGVINVGGNVLFNDSGDKYVAAAPFTR